MIMSTNTAEKPNTANNLRVVGIGSSAGGLEVLKQLLGDVSKGDNLCMIIVQHLEPHHDSMMAEILSRHSELEVKQAENGDSIQTDKAYVIPPNRYISVESGSIKLTDIPENRLKRMPIDHLFTSIAETFHERCIGIILTGTGSDGTGGIQLIQEHGGLTIAQDPSEAAYDGMPRSAINSGSIDQVLKIAEMIPAMKHFIRYQSVKIIDQEKDTQQDQDELEDVMEYIRSQTEHDFRAYKRNSLSRRVRRRMGLNHISSISGYLEHLQSNPQELKTLLRDLLISVTHFFRDTEAFQALEKQLREYFDHTENRKREELRAWVPGCATGEEAYSIAILLLEQARIRDSASRVQVFGTDIDEKALEKARKGHYGEYIAGKIPPEYLDRYFIELEDGYKVTKTLRDAVLFSPQNILEDPPFSNLDLISCRNLLIYLQRDVHDKIFSTFHFALRKNGLLFLGNAETAGKSESLFTVLDRSHRIYKRRSNVSPRMLRSNKNPNRSPIFQGKKSEAQSKEGIPEYATLRSLTKAFGPAAAAIDNDDQIRYLHGKVGKYLELPGGEPRYEISDLLKKGLSARTMAAVRSVRNEGSTFDEIINYQDEGAWKTVRLVVMNADDSPGLLIIAFQEIKEYPEITVDQEIQSAEAKIIRSLEDELESTKAQLKSTVEEMESANEELRASNEEVLSMNEEFQSTNEELETSKEEMQSMNEELTTVNSELEEKIEQLEQANHDLENLFDSTDQAILFFDNKSRLRKYSNQAVQLFGLTVNDTGCSLKECPKTLQEMLDESELTAVFQENKRSRIEIKGSDGKWYQRKIFPYKKDTNQNNGIVAAYTNVTELKETQEELSQLLERYRSLSENSSDIIVRFDQEHRHIFINQHITSVVDISPEEYMGKTNQELGFPKKLCDFWDHHLRRAFKTGERQSTEFTIEDNDGRIRHFDWTLTPEQSKGKNTVLAVARDITDLINARDRLEKALADREVLIKDVHHRVKNNLFLLVGLLMMERKKLTRILDNPEPAVESLNKVMSRIQIISEIYRYLYETSGQAELLETPKFLKGLTDLIQKAYKERKIKLTVESENIMLPVNTAIPLGLIINEAITNSFKHAFPDGKKGNISVEFKKGEEQTAILRITDDGVGFSDNQEQDPESVGRSLITTLTEQIDGSLNLLSENGTRITITFPLPSKSG